MLFIYYSYDTGIFWDQLLLCKYIEVWFLKIWRIIDQLKTIITVQKIKEKKMTYKTWGMYAFCINLDKRNKQLRGDLIVAE